MSQMQNLENRKLLSATLHGGSLVVRGSNTVNDAIHVSLSSDASQITVAENADATQSFAKSSVKRIFIYSYGGNDAITVDANVTARTDILAGAGNDTISTGGGGSYVDAGAGNDTVIAGNAKNFIFGGSGNDSILGGTKSDQIWGGAGNDTIAGGDGSDVISGDAGNDNLDGGASSDHIYGGTGNDTISGDDGNDRLWGQGGSDSITGGNGDDVLGGVSGTNTLTGGAGKDTFWVKTTLAGQTTDYDPNADVLHISKPSDGSAGT